MCVCACVDRAVISCIINTVCTFNIRTHEFDPCFFYLLVLLLLSSLFTILINIQSNSK